ncbi:MAG: GntR family transcriptional regulator [Bacillaceae bacterium]
MTIRTDARQLYLQVIDRIKDDIESGIYVEGSKLPSEFELSKSFGVSRATLREALRVLEEENIIIRKHGVGTFVNQKPVFHSGIEQLNSITNMIKYAGKNPGTVVVETEIASPTMEDRNKFSLSSDGEEAILTIKRVRTADNEPVVFCEDRIPTTILSSYDYEEESLFMMIQKKSKVQISYAVADIEPLGNKQDILNILKCDEKTSVLVLKQSHYDQHDQLVLYSVNYFRADKFRFHVLRKRV